MILDWGEEAGVPGENGENMQTKEGLAWSPTQVLHAVGQQCYPLCPQAANMTYL